MATTRLPIAVIGAGPIGLAAAAQLITRGETPVVFEAGETVGASVLHWGHVRLFSPWRYLVDIAAASLLSATGWTMPDPDALPTGRELVRHYLAPLAALPELAPHLRLGTRVMSVARHGFDKMKTAGRDDAPFALHMRAADGSESVVLARAVIDASGTFTIPNPLGASGVPAVGEAALAGQIFAGIPAILGRQKMRYAGRTTLVVGSGHSAFNALLDLGKLARIAPGTRIVWAVRRPDAANLFGGEGDDRLPARGALGARLRDLVATGQVQRVTGFQAAQIARIGQQIVVSDGEGTALPAVDEIIVTTGFRPDLSFLSEVRLDLDPAVESPRALASLIDPNIHSCGTVPPHGATALTQPERDFYIVGMKSYGRAPTFLMRTGYEQVRSVACALTGDLAGAAATALVLPETGVCSSGIGEATGAQETTLPSSVREPVLVGANAGVACCGA